MEKAELSAGLKALRRLVHRMEDAIQDDSKLARMRLTPPTGPTLEEYLFDGLDVDSPLDGILEND